MYLLEEKGDTHTLPQIYTNRSSHPNKYASYASAGMTVFVCLVRDVGQWRWMMSWGHNKHVKLTHRVFSFLFFETLQRHFASGCREWISHLNRQCEKKTNTRRGKVGVPMFTSNAVMVCKLAIELTLKLLSAKLAWLFRQLTVNGCRLKTGCKLNVDQIMS